MAKTSHKSQQNFWLLFYTHKYILSNRNEVLRDSSGGKDIKTLFPNYSLSTDLTILWWDNEPRSSSVRYIFW